MRHYILKDKEVVEVDFAEWTEWFATADRHVADETIDNVRISTVFLSADYSFQEGPPVLFETMVFGGKLDQEMDRYCTWEQAETGHKAMKQRVQESI